MDEPRKQHYVPQTYLHNFGIGKKNSSLYVLSLSPQKIYPSQIGDTACQKDFYTLSGCDDKYIWETTYAQQVEPNLGILLKKVRRICESILTLNRAIVISQEEKIELSFHLAIQLLRGKNARNYEKILYDKTLPKVLNEVKNHFPDVSDDLIQSSISRFTQDDTYFKNILMGASLNKRSIQKFVKILSNYTFIFYRTQGTYPFITTDNPVMFLNSITKDSTPFTNGLLSNSTIVYFPISPKLLLCAYHPDLSFELFNRFDCSLLILNDEKDKRFIDSHNKYQLKQCNNCAYSNSKETLENLLKNRS